jgi:tripeptide aminopeptidase
VRARFLPITMAVVILWTAVGGTDGSRLSERGLPTPNILTAGHDFHPCHKWICVADVRAAVATIVHLAQVWAQESTKGEKRLDA